MNLMNRPNRQWTVASYPVAERSVISNFYNGFVREKRESRYTQPCLIVVSKDE